MRKDTKDMSAFELRQRVAELEEELESLAEEVRAFFQLWYENLPDQEKAWGGIRMSSRVYPDALVLHSKQSFKVATSKEHDPWHVEIGRLRY